MIFVVEPFDTDYLNENGRAKTFFQAGMVAGNDYAVPMVAYISEKMGWRTIGLEKGCHERYKNLMRDALKRINPVPILRRIIGTLRILISYSKVAPMGIVSSSAHLGTKPGLYDVYQDIAPYFNALFPSVASIKSFKRRSSLLCQYSALPKTFRLTLLIT